MTYKAQMTLAALLVFHALLCNPYWETASKALRPDGKTYQERRIYYGFDGLPLDRVSQRLNGLLPLESPVALSEGIRTGGLEQRYFEALYPRIVDPAAVYTLDVVDARSAKGESGTVLFQDSPSRAFLLKGPAPRTPVRTAATEDFKISWFAFTALTLGAIGYGTLLLALLERNSATLVLPATAVLAGALVLGWIVTVATWFQVPLPWKVLGLAGILCCLVRSLVILRRSETRQIYLGFFSQAARLPENWALLLIVVLFFAQVAVFPVSMWDGRSVWLFHTKQIFFQGMFSKADLLHRPSEWSHPDYPLLFPGWLSFFSSFSQPYNERMASLGIPVLVASLVSLAWFLLRRQIGRWSGAAVTLASFFAIARMTGGGYADGILMFLLLVEFIAFLSPTYYKIGWVAAGAAALLKAEGLVFASVIIILCLVWHRRLQYRNPQIFLVSSLFVVPAMLHIIWTRSVGLRGTYPTFHRIESLGDLVWRCSTIDVEALKLLQFGGYIRAQALLWEGLVGLILALACWIALKGWDFRGKFSILLACAFYSVAYLMMLLTPYDLKGQVASAFDRLLFHAAVVCLLAPFLMLGTARR